MCGFKCGHYRRAEGGHRSCPTCYPVSLLPKPHGVYSPLGVHSLPLGNQKVLFGPKQIHHDSDYGPFFLELSHHNGLSRNACSGRIFSNGHIHPPLLFFQMKSLFPGEEAWLGLISGRMPSLHSEHQVRGCFQDGYSHVPSLLLMH